MTQEYDIDVLMIAELGKDDEDNLLSAINDCYGTETFVYIPGYNWTKVQVFAKRNH
jgi:hypothetical protein